jgi:hypothetical protein
VIDLERALVDLGEHLDYPIGGDIDRAVMQRIVALDREAVPRSGRRTRVLLAIAAAIVVIVGAVVAIAPARHAVADWLGIGAVDIRRSSTPLSTGSSERTVPGAVVGGSVDPAATRGLAAARRAVGFTIVTPHDSASGALVAVGLDRHVRGGLVVLRYPHFTLAEIASKPDRPVIGKLLDPSASVEPATVDGKPGMWIKGAHEIGYLDRTGNFETDTVRRAGPVLLWGDAGVTYRIEGLRRLADAQAIARTLR